MAEQNIPEKIGKYLIERELGRGAMGIVYQGKDPLIERIVAIKTIRKDLLDNTNEATLFQRFKQEAQAAGRLNHQNIVAVYEYGEDQDLAYIAMEFLKGKELKYYLEEINTRFSLDEIQTIMTQLLSAIAYSHRNGVVHRDLKPANIIVIDDHHDHLQIKITDFGIARLDTSSLTQTGAVMGTPCYMSPEQFQGQRVDGRSDIFSAGVILYQLLTGEKPFTGALTTVMMKIIQETPCRPSLLNLQVPPALDFVVQKAMAKTPTGRYASADEFLNALNQAIANHQAGMTPSIAMPDTEATLVSTDATLIGQDATLIDTRATDATTIATMAPVTTPAPPVSTEATLQQESAPTFSTESVHASPTQNTPSAQSKPPFALGLGIGAALLIGGAVFFLTTRSQTPPATVPPSIQQSAPSMSPAPIKSPEVATGFGRLFIKTIPDNVQIKNEKGETLGSAPITLVLPEGSHQLIFTKPDYFDLEATVEVKKDAEIPFEISLVKKD